MKFWYLFLLFILASGYKAIAQSGNKITREQYIQAFKDIAVAEMNRSGIPASISLAQGMLESDNGNSTLARKANNHFGIKCHDWEGETIYHDDDDDNECFRKYDSPKDSYRDHTDFLLNGSRYVFLFYLDQTDYKGWARGLEKAGYATTRSYAKDLIRIIEENELFVYDTAPKRKKRKPVSEEEVVAISDSSKVVGGKSRQAGEKVTGEKTLSGTQHEILTLNRINYIIVNKGDTYLGISEEFKLLPFELARYNEIERNAELDSGQVLFIQPKRNKASVEYKFHKVAEGETMYQIAQKYGIKLQKLYEKNLMNEGTEPSPGDILTLRKPKKGEAPVEEVPGEKEEGPVIEFEF
jgi:LysM repeat protein